MKFLLLLTLALPLTLSSGCRASAPTSFERSFADVQTNWVTRVVNQTNVVTLTNTSVQVQVVTLTNQVGVPVPIYQTNLVPVVVSQTNVVTVTNAEATYVLTPKATTKAVVDGIGTATNLVAPGSGGLVSAGIMGLMSLYLGFRNRQFAGRNTALSQSAGVLAQIIETGREVLATTPQGKDANNAFTQWMVSHQADTKTIALITDLVRQNVSNEEAQKAAAQILALINAPSTNTKA